MASRVKRLITLAKRYDRMLATAEQSAIDAMNRSIDRAYRELVRDLEKGWSAIAANKSIIPQQQRLLLAEELGETLQVIRPGQRQEYRDLLEGAILRSDELGDEYTDAIHQTLFPSAQTAQLLQGTTGVPAEALRNQVEEGLNRLYRHGDDAANLISETIQQGLIQNWGVRRTAAALETGAGLLKSKAETIARTETMSAFNGATINRLEQSGALVQWLAVGDERMCPSCGNRNMRVYKAKDIHMPAHPLCRCVASPMRPEWLSDSEFFELGELDEMARYRQEGLDALKRQGKRPRAAAPFDPAGRTPRHVWTPGKPRPTKTAIAPPQPVNPPAPPPPAKPKLPADHTITINPRINSDRIDAALDSIPTAGASDRVSLLRQFFAKHDIQAVFHDSNMPLDDHVQNVAKLLKLKPRGMSLGAITKAHPGTYGYTNQGWKHVTIATNSQGQSAPFEVGKARLRSLVDDLTAARLSDGTPFEWSTSQVAQGDTRDFLTYLHETGHQVHYRAGYVSRFNPATKVWEDKSFRPQGSKAITEYAQTNDKEWFAESFAAWMVDAEAYKKFDPTGAEFIEKTLRETLK